MCCIADEYSWIIILHLEVFLSSLGVTVFLCGLAIAILGSHCHAPTVMLTNFVATPIELR